MKTVIIGASGGIGRAISIHLAKKASKDDIFVFQGKTIEKILSLSKEIGEDKDSVKSILIQFEFDKNFFASKNESKNEPKEQLLYQIQTCDRLIICYGPFLQKPLHEMTIDDWQNVTQQDFCIPSSLVSVALPNMMKKNYGDILLFGGTATDTICSFKTNAAYGAAKIALGSVVKSVANNYSDYNIKCNAILPGFVKTEYVTSEQENHYINLLGGKPMIEVCEIAELANQILSERKLNGELVRFDRGWQRQN